MWDVDLFAANIEETFFEYIPLVVTAPAVVFGLMAVGWALDKRVEKVGRRQNFVKPLVMLGLTAIGLVAMIIALPLKEGTTNQLLSLLGIVLTGIIAFSSTTFVSNAMGGFMIRSVRSFRSGDFIRVGEHFGRVSGRGLFHTEIQTEDRNLTTLPNLYLVTNPVKVVRSSGTIVSAEVSLGYDTSETKVEALLIDAAKRAGLEEPFVHVQDLGDFSVVYRVSGMLTDIKGLMTARSRLRIEALNTLHEAAIEVMSPSVMMQRPLPSERKLIPEIYASSRLRRRDDGPLPETKIFDKAEEAEALERLEIELKTLRERRQVLEEKRQDLPEDDERIPFEKEIESLKAKERAIEEKFGSESKEV